MDHQPEFAFLEEQRTLAKPKSAGLAPVSFPESKPVECPVCHWVCVIEETGEYSGCIDHEPINCGNCKTLVTEYRTTRFLKTWWCPPVQVAS
jgi:hypothetical protein